MKYEGVIFDWAGTTVDYGCFAPVKAFIEAFREFGIEPTAEEVRKPMGMLKIDHVRTMLSMERISRLWEERHQRAWTEEDVRSVYERSEQKIFEVLNEHTDVKPYVTETVHTLREMGVKIGSTTGYTDEMMNIVVPAAKEGGYEPDCWFSPDAAGKKGRPYPYMIFKNVEALGLGDMRKVIKVGDTISDIKEGLHAGITSIGILEGSSMIGLTNEEYETLPADEQDRLCAEAEKKYMEAGADGVIRDIRGILEIIR